MIQEVRLSGGLSVSLSLWPSSASEFGKEPHTGIPWQTGLRRGSALELQDNRIVVREEGFYFLYSQVGFPAAVTTFVHRVALLGRPCVWRFEFNKRSTARGDPVCARTSATAPCQIELPSGSAHAVLIRGVKYTYSTPEISNKDVIIQDQNILSVHGVVVVK